MLSCPSCGTPNRDDAIACHYCGYRFSSHIISRTFWVKLALTIAIPVLVYLLMTRVLLRLL